MDEGTTLRYEIEIQCVHYQLAQDKPLSKAIRELKRVHRKATRCWYRPWGTRLKIFNIDYEDNSFDVAAGDDA